MEVIFGDHYQMHKILIPNTTTIVSVHFHTQTWIWILDVKQEDEIPIYSSSSTKAFPVWLKDKKH